MTNHDFARSQVKYHSHSAEFDAEQMKYYRGIIKEENKFIKEAQQRGYTFTTTAEKKNAERWYRYYYNQKKYDEKMVAKFNKELTTPETTHF